jgi:hypothetical protein
MLDSQDYNVCEVNWRIVFLDLTIQSEQWGYVYPTLSPTCHYTQMSSSVIFTVPFCFLMTSVRLPLWSGGQSSLIQIHMSWVWFLAPSGFFLEIMGLEQGPLSLVSTIEELLERNISGSSLERREYGHGDPLHWPCDSLYLQKLTLTLPRSCCHVVGIVHSWTKDTVVVFFLVYDISVVSDISYN